jgi:hypothetical protein
LILLITSLQGTSLDVLPGVFMQVLQLITNMRSQMRLIRYIGLTRTGLTTKMVSKISRAVASIPIPYDPAVHMPPPRLEIQKVDCTAIAFLFPLPHEH